MEPSPESVLSPELEAFSRGIDALRRHHQQMAVTLCAQRLAHDTEELPRQVFPRRSLRQLGLLLWKRTLARHSSVAPIGDGELTAQVIIIDGTTGVIEQEVSDD